MYITNQYSSAHVLHSASTSTGCAYNIPKKKIIIEKGKINMEAVSLVGDQFWLNSLKKVHINVFS